MGARQLCLCCTANRFQNVLIVLTLALWFWAGIVVAKLFDHAEAKDLIDLGIAIGTIGAVVFTLWQSAKSARETKSLAYREAATNHLQKALATFLAKRDEAGRPYNGRRHWLDFARAIEVSRRMASRIEQPEQREIWREQEHAYRMELWDVLDPVADSYPYEYYCGPPSTPGRLNELEISTPSLKVVYEWVMWPEDLADPLDRKARFSDEALEKMRTFGPRGLATFAYMRQH